MREGFREVGFALLNEPWCSFGDEEEWALGAEDERKEGGRKGGRKGGRGGAMREREMRDMFSKEKKKRKKKTTALTVGRISCGGKGISYP